MAKVLGASDKILDILRKADIELNSQREQEFEDTTMPDTVANLKFAQFVPVRVVSGNGVTGYICDIFEKGLAEPATKQGRVFLANGASTLYVIPAGTVMYAQALNVSKIGTNN